MNGNEEWRNEKGDRIFEREQRGNESLVGVGTSYIGTKIGGAEYARVGLHNIGFLFFFICLFLGERLSKG